MEKLYHPPHTAYMEQRAMTKDGWTWLAWVDTALLDEKGNVREIIGLGRDLSEKKQAEIEKERLQSQLQQAQKMEALGTLVAGVAHEINNPNNFITLNAPMLQKAWESIFPILEQYYDDNGEFNVGGLPFTMMRDRIPQLLAGISDGSGRIKKIVSDLKRFAQPNELVPYEPVDVNGVVKSSLTLVSNLLKNATNNFKVEYGKNIPKVNGNYQHLEQVVINLTQNACQALRDGNKGINVSTAYQEKSDTVLIKVRDEGVGIPAESLSKVMDPFFTSRRSSGGTGLGLSVSSSIIKEHSGELIVSSKEGKGTTFTIALPSGIKRYLPKILVADDDDSVREMLVEAFKQKFQFPVEEASDGMDACFKLGTYQPDLLILDIRMPYMDGVEVCKKIKSESAFSSMKTIVITGFPGSDDAIQIAGMGFDNIIAKPFKIKTFQDMVEKVLNRNMSDNRSFDPEAR
jgi:signal transduction histidine kinase/ActR/RegA family two-component response regulator